MAAVFLGILVGVACATPALYALRVVARAGGRVEDDRLFAGALMPFFLLQLILIAVWRLRPGAVRSFGVSSVLAFLVAVLVGALCSRRSKGGDR